MTTDDAWERLKEAGCPLDLHPLQEQVTKAELGRILLQVHRETVEACAAKVKADGWRYLDKSGQMIGRGPCDVIAAILALVPKEDGR